MAARLTQTNDAELVRRLSSQIERVAVMETNGAGTQGAQRELTRWRNAVIACFTLAGLTVTAWGPRMPSIKHLLAVGAGDLGFALAGTTVGALLGMLVASAVRRRLGGRRGVGFALMLLALALFVLSLGLVMRSVAVVTLAFVLVGLGIGLIEVLVNVEGAEVERRAGRTLMPFMHGTWSLGVAAGAGIGTLCEAVGVSSPAQFAGEGVALCIAAALVPLGIPADRKVDESQPVADPARAGLASRLRGAMRQVDSGLLFIGLVMLGVEVGEGSASAWLTLSVTEGHGGTARFAALAFLVFASAEAAARLGGGRLVDRIGRVAAVRVTGVVGAVGALLFIVADTPGLQMLGVSLWAVGVSMGFPLGMSAAASGGNPALRVSMVASLGYLANLSGPPILGHVADSVGFLNALFVVIAFLLLVAASASALRER